METLSYICSSFLDVWKRPPQSNFLPPTKINASHWIVPICKYRIWNSWRKNPGLNVSLSCLEYWISWRQIYANIINQTLYLNTTKYLTRLYKYFCIYTNISNIGFTTFYCQKTNIQLLTYRKNTHTHTHHRRHRIHLPWPPSEGRRNHPDPDRSKNPGMEFSYPRIGWRFWNNWTEQLMPILRDFF